MCQFSHRSVQLHVQKLARMEEPAFRKTHALVWTDLLENFAKLKVSCGWIAITWPAISCEHTKQGKRYVVIATQQKQLDNPITFDGHFLAI